VINRGDPAGDHLAIKLLHGDVDREVRGRTRGDFLLQRIRVQVDQAGHHIGTLDVDHLEISGKGVGEGLVGSDGRDASILDDQGGVGRDTAGSHDRGIGDEPAGNHGGVVGPKIGGGL
jgi:hypothetical protein